MQGVFRPLVAVESDGKAVHLVLDVCQQPEQFAVRLHSNHLRRKSIQQFVGAVAVVFCQSGDRYVDMHSLPNLINNLVKLRLLNKRQLPVLQPSKNLAQVWVVWLLPV